MGEMEIKLDGDSVHLGRNASFSVGNSETETVKTIIAGSRKWHGICQTDKWCSF